ncbi:ABC transporter permease [Lysinibacillus sp. CD3-6]|uniref:ABC transporter permease n=1 Tax=Lysinibacillus sp. CD3-6 TaxID=2892541 RepID=UPI0011740C24|nr:ABC transporter permease subunit [Lysinibacillus sp. CD3-6]UED81866.1 ABC transporter permease [Lysinibacillus sp. CD3-6]
MTPIYVLTKKEYVQMFRDFKVIWLPLAFMFLGATQPVVTYYLPTILAALGGNQGITIDPSMLQQDGAQVMAATLGSQFDQLGIMIIVIAMMGIIQSDKANGMLDFILTRPVKVGSYIGGKIFSNFSIVAISVTLGYIVSYVYVNFLFSNIPFRDMVLAIIFYQLWVLFMISFTSMISTIFNGQGVIALISIVCLLMFKIISGLHPIIDLVNPAGMSQHAVMVLITGSIDSHLYGNMFITFIWITIIVMFSHYWISAKKYHKN